MTKNEIAALESEIFDIVATALAFVNDNAVPLLMQLPPDERVKTTEKIIGMVFQNAFDPITYNKKTVN